MPPKSRTPQGVRGLKYSLLVVWVMIESRTPQGVRGLKFQTQRGIGLEGLRRTPQGVRGLKYQRFIYHGGGFSVAPRKGCVD